MISIEDLLKLLQSFEGLKDALFGVPLIVIIWALTQGAKTQFSLTGKAVEYVSFGIGVVVGLGYKVSTGIGPDFAWWFQSVIYAALMGVIPSLLYKAAQDVVQGALWKSARVEERIQTPVPLTPEVTATLVETYKDME